MSRPNDQRYGARSLDSYQGDREPGPVPQRDPPQATGGNRNSGRGKRRKKRRVTRRERRMEGNPNPRRSLNILQWNAEGVFRKKLELAERMNKENIDIACIQETHLNSTHRFQVRGYECFRSDRIERHKGGVLILVRNSINAEELRVETNQQAEINGADITHGEECIRIYNAYCPPDRDLSLEQMTIPNQNCVVVGDFNSQSERWGYDETNDRGDEVEDWEIDSNLHIINQENDEPTFYHRGWMTTSTPDLAFTTENLKTKTTRTVLAPLSTSDHKPIKISIDFDLPAPQANCFPRWNYRKANMALFQELTDSYTKSINTRFKDSNKMTKSFTSAVLKAATESIPRGARKDYKPYWTEELQEIEDNLIEARKRVEEIPTTENNILLKEAAAKYKLTSSKAARKSWKEKTESLNFDKDGSKLWKIAKTLSNESTAQGKTTLKHNGETLTGKKAADHFVDIYAKISTLEIPTENKKEAKTRDDEPEPEDMKGAEEIMTQNFKEEEMEEAIRKLKKRKSPGPDGITNEMIQNLGPRSKKILLKILNCSWKTGTVPQCWREANMIPILKKGKDKTKAESYRPISLTSCLGKLMESMVNARLMWHLEEKQAISPEQAAFRQHRSTEDQVTYLSQSIEDAFQEGNNTLAVWIDLEKAFDKVWRRGLEHKLRRAEITNRMYTWIKQYLKNRKARVNLQGKKSKKKLLRQGVPQGGVLSPSLFIIFFDDIIKELPRGVRGAIYADDLVLWCSEKYIGTAQVRLQTALDKIIKWTKKWIVTINKSKTTYSVFTLSTKEQTAKLFLDGQRLKEDATPTYLGVTFDRRLTWTKHTNTACSRAKLRISIMKKLAGTDWGADQSILKKLYVGRVRPVLEYGIAAWGTTSESNFKKLNRVQNQAQRIMTGAMRSTPIQKMEEITGIGKVEGRRDSKAMTQAAKFERLETHPMHERMKKPTKKRLKRSNFVRKTREIERTMPDMKDQTAKLIPPTATRPPWSVQKFPEIKTRIPGIDKKKNQTMDELKALSLEHMKSEFPQQEWTHVFTDGSATEATRNGGAGAIILFNDESETISIPTGRFSSNFRAETEAISEAAKTVASNSSRAMGRVVIFTDALSVLQALENPNNKDMNELRVSLMQVSAATEQTVLQWIPSHCGIDGNEEADRLAGEGSLKDQTNQETSYEEAKTLIKRHQKKKWLESHPGHSKKDPYHNLDRGEQVKIFRLRTGHNRLRHHLHTKFRIGTTGLCPCNEALMTAEHILQECRIHQRAREKIWPSPVALGKKLYGTLEELRATAAFIVDIGVDI